MTDSVQSIVGELIAFDPSLAKHRGALESAVRDILASKPDTHFTAAFRRRLLAELRSNLAREQDAPSASFPLFPMLQRVLFAGGGAIVGALLVVLIINGPLTAMPYMNVPETIPTPQTVRDAGPAAFGALAPPAANSRPQSGGGGGGYGGGMEMDSKISAIAPDAMPLPDMAFVEYSYDGDITLPQGDVDVFRRNPASASTSVDNLITGSFAAQLFDIRRFSGMKAQNMTMTSGKYSLSVDFMDGNVWINRNYLPSDRPENHCRDQACFEKYRLKEADMLPDDSVIGIAEDFLATYGIDTARYGKPEVMNDWRVWLAASASPRDFYFPEQVTVTFPLLIDGVPVYEEYGNPYGLQVTVDLRLKEVSSVGNLRMYDVEQSAYPAIDDEALLRQALKNGGTPQWFSDAATKVTATLDAPAPAYIHIYQWDEKGMQNTELFVPGLVFPVLSMPKGADQYRTHVVLPLAKEMVQRINADQQDGRPMPLDTVRY